MPKNKEKTWKQILKECEDYDSSGRLSWAYVTALRGPDIMVGLASNSFHIKAIFTCPLRGKINEAPDVRAYGDMSLLYFEEVFNHLNYLDTEIQYRHYLSHIKSVWRFFNPKVERILEELGNVPDVKELARQYKEAVDEWLESENLIVKEEK